LQNDAKKKEEILATRAKEIAELKSHVDGKLKHVSELESAGEKAQQEAASQAKRAEDLVTASRIKIAALESQLNAKEELARQKESTIKELEQKVSAKIQDLETLAKNKQELLAGRDAVIGDLRSQLKLLTKGIGEMSSFFKQAQAFTVVERQDVRPAFSNAPLNRREEKPLPQSNAAKVTPIVQEERPVTLESNGAKAPPFRQEEKPAAVRSDATNSMPIVQEEKPVTAQSNITPTAQEEKPPEIRSNGTQGAPVVQESKPVAVQSNATNVMPTNPDVAPEIISPDVFERMSDELAEVVGVMNPLATLIVREHVEGLGESIEKFPKTRLQELFDSLARELLDEKRQVDFRKRLAQNAGIA
jgi:uncharacterized protein (DUF3084 family)